MMMQSIASESIRPRENSVYPRVVLLHSFALAVELKEQPSKNR